MLIGFFHFLGVTLLFTEPPDAKKPNVRWRLYVFKGGEALNGKSCIWHVVYVYVSGSPGNP